MNEDKIVDEAAPSVRGPWAPLLILAVATSGLILAHDFSEAAARMPKLVCWVLIAFGLVDLYSRFPLPGQSLINGFFGSGFEHREMRRVPPLGREFKIIGWMLLCFVGLAVFGLLITLPLFCLAYVRLEARRPLSEALIASVIVLLFQYGVFEILLDYELYKGLLFSKGGFARW
jgi:hypothetical protein